MHPLGSSQRPSTGCCDAGLLGLEWSPPLSSPLPGSAPPGGSLEALSGLCRRPWSRAGPGGAVVVEGKRVSPACRLRVAVTSALCVGCQAVLLLRDRGAPQVAAFFFFNAVGAIWPRCCGRVQALGVRGLKLDPCLPACDRLVGVTSPGLSSSPVRGG